MKITELKLYRLPPRWLLLAVHTDTGIVGWGEPIVEGRVESVAAAVKELSSYIIGKNPCRINDIWQTLYRSGFYRGGAVLMSALAGIDQALWDILGKDLGKPVYELLGGTCRDKMKIYTWVGGDNPSDEIANIEQQVKRGRDTVKLNGCGKLKLVDSHKAIDTIVERVGRIRERFGADIDFGLDFHGRVSVPMAKPLLKELEFARPLFVEEPVLPEHSGYYASLGNSTSIILTAGERFYSRYDFRSVLEKGGLGIIQPDPSHAGGISECLRIASMADAYGVGLAPHCPLGPVALASCLAIDFVSFNAVIQEFPINIHYNTGNALLDYVVNKDDFLDEDGYIKPLSGPGLGVEIDIKAVEQAQLDSGDWKPPLWRHDDGTLAEW